MLVDLCPACSRANAPDARRCAGCGRKLRAGDTVPAALSAATAAPGPGAVWLDDLQAAAATAPEPTDEPLSLTLREIEPPLPPLDSEAAPQPAASTSTSDSEPPAEIVVSDPEMTFPPLIYDEPPARAAPAPKPAPAAPGAPRADARAARRAHVRRARLRAAPARSGGGDDVPEVLVVDADESARAALCTLLLAFGYGVHSIDGVAKATVLLASRRFVAAFVDVATDGSDGGAGIELCRQVKRADAATLLVQVSARLRPVDRVRSQLAGCDDIVEKPVARGSVARVLDQHGIALPSDARHA
jgi:CheY-like chemotaxis protein